MKGHIFNQLVNDLRDIAITFGHTQQLRSRISSRLKIDIPIDEPKPMGLFGLGVVLGKDTPKSLNPWGYPKEEEQDFLEQEVVFDRVNKLVNKPNQ